MIRSFRKATTGLAVALMLVGISTSVQGFTGMYSTVTRGEQRAQLIGKLVCTDCSVAEARKAQSQKYANHLYQLHFGDQRAVMEVRETTHSSWLNHLMQPTIRVRGENDLLRALTNQDNVRKDVRIAGSLLDGHTLNVQEIAIHQ